MSGAGAMPVCPFLDVLHRPNAEVWSSGAWRDEGRLEMNVQVAETALERPADIAMTVALTMRQMGVLGTPRNYEIFYEALNGSSPELGSELATLGLRPKQKDLDRIGQKYFSHNHDYGIVDSARDTVTQQLDEIARILVSERIYIEK